MFDFIGRQIEFVSTTKVGIRIDGYIDSGLDRVQKSVERTIGSRVDVSKMVSKTGEVAQGLVDSTPVQKVKGFPAVAKRALSRRK